MKSQSGLATLTITIILMIATLLMMAYAINDTIMQQKTTSNQNSGTQAFQAAEAGLAFGIAYLTTNSSTITGSASGGYINYGASDSNLTNVALANGSKFSVVYTNPTQNNYQLIQVTSTGNSADGTATRTVSQLVQQRTLLQQVPTNPASVLGTASLKGSANITNLQSSTTIVSGSTISFQGSATTLTLTGGSNAAVQGSDIQPNASALSGVTANAFFQSYFGTTPSVMKTIVANYYPSGSSPNLNGVTGTSIWIDEDYTQNGNITIGSITSPVLLIVNGNFSIGGNLNIYGFVFVTGGTTSTITGSPNITGGFATTGNLLLQGTPTIVYSSTVLNSTLQSSMFYPKVSGSWKDF